MRADSLLQRFPNRRLSQAFVRLTRGMSGRQRRVLTPALIAAAAVACWSSSSSQLFLGANAFVGSGVAAFWWSGLPPGETCSNSLVGSTGNGERRRRFQRTKHQQHYSTSQRSRPRYRGSCRDHLPIACSPLSTPSRRSKRFRLYAGKTVLASLFDTVCYLPGQDT